MFAVRLEPSPKGQDTVTLTVSADLVWRPVATLELLTRVMIHSYLLLATLLTAPYPLDTLTTLESYLWSNADMTLQTWQNWELIQRRDALQTLLDWYMCNRPRGRKSRAYLREMEAINAEIKRREAVVQLTLPGFPDSIDTSSAM